MDQREDHVVHVVRAAGVPADLTDQTIRDLVVFALERERATEPWQISIAFVEEAEIERLHREFMGLNEPTDILTFADEIDGEPLGDIAICVPVAAEQAGEYGHTLADELAFLVLHGILHLLGHDDQEASDRMNMLSRQQELLDDFRASRA